MVVVAEAGETVTRPLMIRVTEEDGANEIEGSDQQVAMQKKEEFAGLTVGK